MPSSTAAPGAFPFWTIAADIATTFGVIIALVGGVAAILAYLSAKRASEDVQMCALFREQLRVCLDHDLGARHGDGPAGDSPAGALGAQLAGLKLHALDMMWAWIRRQERSALFRWRLIPRWQERRDFLNAWRATILVHVNQDREAAAESILRHTPCYTVSFLEHVAEGWAGDRRRMKGLVQDQRHQMNGNRRQAYDVNESRVQALARRLADSSLAPWE
jgi:hypothetical protein